jgi:hypothetical protein
MHHLQRVDVLQTASNVKALSTVSTPDGSPMSADHAHLVLERQKHERFLAQSVLQNAHGSVLKDDQRTIGRAQLLCQGP